MAKLKGFLFRLVRGYLIVALVLVLIQDVQVYPGAAFSLFTSNTRDPKTLPTGVSSSFVETADSKRLELWRLSPEPEYDTGFHAIVFHGNAATVDNFFPYQQWLQAVGITSYDFDYRGYGHSSGWPSENGLYLDAEAVWKHLTEELKIPRERILIVGISIGTGPATYLAREKQPLALLLFAPYASLRAVARATPVFGHLAVFLWSTFPASDYIAGLKNTVVFAAHGSRDSVISSDNTSVLEGRYRGSGGFHKFIYEAATHNDILYHASDDMARAVLKLLAETPP
jgi:fermentation-respiration switch protein FrsA (DUF1100 family)